MTAPLAGQVALVTGAGKGIGRAASLALHGAGAAIVAVARTPGDAPGTAGHVAAEITAAGGTAIAIPCDVGRAREADAAVAEAVARLGRLDILVNNAGIFRPTVATERLDPATWQATIDTNLGGAFHCARAAIPHLRVRGGAIINVTGTAGDLDAPLIADVAVSVSKAAINRLTTYLAAELAGSGIAVNSLDPLAVWTEGTAEQYPELAGEPVWGDVADVGPAIVFLARQRSELTGARVRRDEVAPTT